MFRKITHHCRIGVIVKNSVTIFFEEIEELPYDIDNMTKPTIYLISCNICSVNIMLVQHFSQF